MDGVLNQAAAAGLRSIGPPPGGIRPLNGKVLVVPEHRGHWRPQRPTLHQVTEGPEDRSTAQDEAALTRHAGRVDGLHQLRGASEVDVEGLLAEDGASCGQRLVHRGPVGRRRRADPDGIGAAGDLRGIGEDVGVVTADDVGETPSPAFAPVVHRHDLRLDDTAVDQGLDAQTVRPGDKARPDEADAQHVRDIRRWCPTSSVRRRVGGGCGLTPLPPRALSGHRLCGHSAGQRVDKAQRHHDEQSDLVALSAPDGQRGAHRRR